MFLETTTMSIVWSQGRLILVQRTFSILVAFLRVPICQCALLFRTSKGSEILLRKSKDRSIKIASICRISSGTGGAGFEKALERKRAPQHTRDINEKW